MRYMTKRIVLAAAFTLAGGAAALAQGMPPGGPWHSGWPSFVKAERAQAMNASGASVPRVESRATTTRNNGSVPVASNTHPQHRGG